MCDVSGISRCSPFPEKFTIKNRHEKSIVFHKNNCIWFDSAHHDRHTERSRSVQFNIWKTINLYIEGNQHLRGAGFLESVLCPSQIVGSTKVVNSCRGQDNPKFLVDSSLNLFSRFFTDQCMNLGLLSLLYIRFPQTCQESKQILDIHKVQ